MPDTAFTPAPETARAFRDALGAFPTGVTVVTAQRREGPIGMTANSFASVSLDPPLVLWSPARASSRFGAFVAAAHYAVHVLAEDRADLAGRFARSGQGFGPVAHEAPHGVPLLAEGWVARFVCARTAVHDGGDHAIIVGRVLRVETAQGAPLVFARGQYGKVCALPAPPGKALVQ